MHFKTKKAESLIWETLPFSAKRGAVDAYRTFFVRISEEIAETPVDLKNSMKDELISFRDYISVRVLTRNPDSVVYRDYNNLLNLKEKQNGFLCC